jgi:hypothetical protein
VIALVAPAAAAQQAAPPSPVARTVTITEAVLAGGAPLAPGKYELRLAAGAGNPTQRDVEFVANGAVVARETAEIVPAPASVGTSGGAAGRVRVEKLKGGEFVRVSFIDGSDRFLIYLPATQP